MNCTHCLAPERVLYGPGHIPALTQVYLGNWISLARCDQCGALWCSSLYEPYAAFEYLVRWDNTTEAWQTAHAADAGQTLRRWHAAAIRLHWPHLPPAEREKVEQHRQRSHGHNPIDQPELFSPTAPPSQFSFAHVATSPPTAGASVIADIRYAPALRYISLLGALTFLGIAVISWLAYRVEGAQFGLVLLWPMLGIGLGWLIALAAAPQSVRFGPDHLTVQRWLGLKKMPYTTITAVVQTWPFIMLRAGTHTLYLPQLFANDDAKLKQALEAHVPVAQQARAQRLARGLPIVLTGKIAAPLLMTLSGLGLLAFGVGSGGYALFNPIEQQGLDRIGLLLFSLVSVILGASLVYLLLWTYPYRTTFTLAYMTQHFLARTTTQPMQGVVGFQAGYTSRIMRGIPRRVYHITFTYANGTTFRWTPHEFSFPIDYVEAEAAGFVNELTDQLRRAYRSHAPPPTG